MAESEIDYWSNTFWLTVNLEYYLKREPPVHIPITVHAKTQTQTPPNPPIPPPPSTLSLLIGSFQLLEYQMVLEGVQI